MAIQKVTYDDKVDLQIWASIPNTNKIKAQDMNEIKGAINENADELSSAKDEITNQDSEIEALMKALPSETQEDENINIKGTIPVKFKEFVVGGNSKQKTRSGKNLLPYPYDNIANTIIQDLEDGRLTLNGTIVENVSKNIKTFDLKAGNYKFLFNNENLPNNSYFYIRNQDTSATLKTNIKTNTTFTLEEDLQIRIYLILVAGTYSNYEMDLMILEATEEDETWEPYGAMPSPEYPSEIQNVEGNVNVSVCNKNLFNLDEFKSFFHLTETGTNEGHDYVGYTTHTEENPNFMEGQLKKNTQYTLSFYGRQKNTSSQGQTSGFNIKYTDGTSLQKFVDNNEVWTKYTITSAVNKTINNISMLWGYGGTIWLSDIQLEEGDTTDYVEHQEQTVTFPLAQGQRLMLGDYLASDGIHHVRKQMELDGTEDWALALTNTDTLTFQIVNNNLPVKIPNDNDEIVMISNYFKGFSRNQFNNDKETESISPNISNGSKAIIITINKTTAENLNDFKSWLAAQKQAGTPVIIEYELAEEEIEPYTEEQQEAYNQICNLKAYEEETNVFSTNEISPIFKVTAVKDVNSVITQLNSVLLERS